jgi:hypothetical protein
MEEFGVRVDQDQRLVGLEIRVWGDGEKVMQ